MQREKDKIKNLGTNKTYQRISLVVEDFSVAIAFLIACYGGKDTAKLGLGTKKRELPRHSLYLVPCFDQFLSLLLDLWSIFCLVIFTYLEIQNA